MPTETIENVAPAQGWYAIAQQKESDEAEIRIYDVIGSWGISASAFVADLASITAKTINVRLNTPGGEVFDGTAIYNALKAHSSRVVMHIDGVAASAGSFIAMSGDEIRMADNAYLMIHNARGGVMGEADEMRAYADVLEKINGNIADMYAKKAGKDRGYWATLMDAETWFTAEEAKAEGLVDSVVAADKKMKGAKAEFDFKVYNQAKIPDAVRELWGLTPPQNQTPQPTQNTSSAPDEPLRSDSPTAQVAQQKDNDMSSTTTAAPAQAPDAGAKVVITQGNDEVSFSRQAIASYIENGKKLGIEEGRAQELTRMQKLIEAAPGRPQLVIEAFVNRQAPEALSLAFRAAQVASTESEKIAQELRTENARLQAQIAAGGHVGVAMHVTSGDAPEPQSYDLEPEVRAEMEWDSKPALRAQFANNKKAYTLYRVNALKGNVRVMSKSA